MKKYLIKGLKITGITAGVLLLILILIPVLFGDQIKQAVKDYINEELNAKVEFSDVSISVFSNFPHLTVSLEDFSVVGMEEFAGDTLMSLEDLGVVVDLWSVFGSTYKVNQIELNKPRIFAKVLKNGKPNWDIMKPSEEEPAAEEEESAPLSLKLSSYEINDGYIVYDDHYYDMYVEVEHLFHEGSGDFQENVFDFETFTEAGSVTFIMEDVAYLNKTKVNGDITLSIDSENYKYTMKTNRVGLNDMNLHFDGWIAMPTDDIDMDLSFKTEENTFKNFLSILPGMYTEDFADVDADGNFTLEGKVKGTYSETKMPGFNVHVAVNNGRFKYPDLSETVKAINFDVKVDCPDGDFARLGINCPKFHAELGNMPIDAKAIITNAMGETVGIDASAKATVDLAKLDQMFPIEGQEMRGIFTLNGTAKGSYNEASNQFPNVDAVMSLADGFYKNEEFPTPISNMSMQAEMKNAGTDLENGYLNVKNFHAEIEGEPMDASLEVQNFLDPAYNLVAKGRLDLAKLDKIYPIEGSSMAGKIALDLTTSGRMSDVEAERYDRLPTSGSLTAEQVVYKSTDLPPAGVTIDQGLITFTPREMVIEQYTGKLGSSPVNIKGGLSNYLAYMTGSGEVLKGNLTMNSSRFNVNEWMSEEEAAAGGNEAEGASPEEVPMEVFEVPADIDFTFNCSIGTVTYDKLKMENLRGLVIMRNQEVRFENLNFNTLGGSMRLAGGYNTQDIKDPKIDLNMAMANVDVQQTYQTFALVEALAPAAKFLDGKLNSSLVLKGSLLGDMSPNLASITSVGDINVLNGALKGFKPLQMVSDKIKLAKLNELTLKDTKILYEVKDGRVWVEPFDVDVASGKMVVDGSHGLDQSMDYNLDFDVPGGAAGKAAMDAVSGLLGSNAPADGNMRVAVGLGGTVDKPKITYVRTGGGDGVKDALTDKVDELKDTAQDKIDEVKETVDEKIDEVKETVQEKVDDAKEQAKAEAERIMKQAEASAAKIRQEGKTAADKIRAEAEKQASDLEAKAKNPLEKAAAKKAAEKIRKEGIAKADKVEQEADQKADKVMADARARADQLLK